MDKLHDWAKLLPLGTLLIILLSSVKQLLFFSLFNVNITDFLQVQEYVTLFIDDLLYYTIAFGLGLFLYVKRRLYPKKEVKEKKNKSGKEIKRELWLLVVISSVLVSGSIIALCMTDDMTLKLTIANYTAIGSIFGLFIYSIIKKWNVSYPLFILTLLASRLVLDSFHSAYKIFEGDGNFEYQIQLEGDESCLKNRRYIGKSEEFLFLYNTINGETIILKNEDINKIKIVRSK